MVHRPAETPVVSQEIVDSVVDRFRPTRVILFGSRARGDARPNSDYDFLVEMECEGALNMCAGEVVNELAKHNLRADVVVLRPGQLEEQRDDPGRMAWDIAREGIVLYPAKMAGLAIASLIPLPSARRVRESRPPQSLAEWRSRAEQDLIAIENNLRSEKPAWSYICFHAQQAAEKYLKMLLIERHIHPPSTHDMEKLVSAVRAAGFALPNLDADCALLQPYAVDARYPSGVAIPEAAHATRVLDAGRRIVALVGAQMGDCGRLDEQPRDGPGPQ
jgi:HEPN domain-containing protein/predicted nucleotidyltransferase